MLTPFSPEKIIIHADRIRHAIDGKMPPPVTVGLDISNKCNHACKWCLYDKYKQECNVNMSLELIRKCIKEMSDARVKSICLSGGGSPTMNEYINEAIRCCVSNGMQVSLNTNGSRLNHLSWEAIECLSYIRVSLDAGSGNTHKQLHGVSENEFDHIIENIDRIKKFSSTKIGVGYLVHPLNCKEIYETIKLLDSINVDYVQIRPLKNVDLSVEEKSTAFDQLVKAKCEFTIQVYESFAKMNDTINKHITYKTCYANRLVGNIGPDGKVYICCELRGINPIGDINDNTFSEIWFSQKHIDIVNNLDVTKCPSCKYAKCNEIIEDIFINKTIDENFI